LSIIFVTYNFSRPLEITDDNIVIAVTDFNNAAGLSAVGIVGGQRQLQRLHGTAVILITTQKKG